jgi:Type II secretion system (T2SS), protein E, N-terminal domain
MSRLGALMVQEGILTASDRQLIKRESVNHHGSFARSILALGLLDEDELSALFASKTCFRQAAKDVLHEMDLGVMNIVPLHVLAWLEILPLHIKEGALFVAMVDPTDQDVISQMHFFTGLRVIPVITTRSEIKRGLKEIGAVAKIGQSHFESFIKTHGRMSQAVQKKKSKPRKKMTDNTIADLAFNADGVGPHDFNEGRSGDDLDALENSATMFTGDMGDSGEEANSDLNSGLSAASPGESADGGGVSAGQDLGALNEDVEAAASGVSDGAGEASQAASASETAGLAEGADDEVDFGSLDDDLNFDALETGGEKTGTTPAKSEGVQVADSSDDPSPSEGLLADTEGDDDIDLDLDLGSGSFKGAAALPGGLEDPINLGVEDLAADDNAMDAMNSLEDESSGFSLEGGSDQLSLGSDDLNLQDDSLDLSGLDLESPSDQAMEVPDMQDALGDLSLPDDSLDLAGREPGAADANLGSTDEFNMDGAGDLDLLAPSTPSSTELESELSPELSTESSELLTESSDDLGSLDELDMSAQNELDAADFSDGLGDLQSPETIKHEIGSLEDAEITAGESLDGMEGLNGIEGLDGMEVLDESAGIETSSDVESLGLDSDEVVASSDPLFGTDGPGIDDMTMAPAMAQPSFDGVISADGEEPTLDFGPDDQGSPLETHPAIDGDGGQGHENPSREKNAAAPAKEVSSASAPDALQSSKPNAGKEANLSFSGSAHNGIAVLNRALIQLQLSSDPVKAMHKVAEASSKAGIKSGAMVTLKGGKLAAGVLWRQTSDGLSSGVELPAGIDPALVSAFAKKAGRDGTWTAIDDALGRSSIAIKKAWPDAANPPSMVLVREHGDSIVVTIAAFSGASDHEGLKNSFADVIRAVSSKL